MTTKRIAAMFPAPWTVEISESRYGSSYIFASLTGPDGEEIDSLKIRISDHAAPVGRGGGWVNSDGNFDYHGEADLSFDPSVASPLDARAAIAALIAAGQPQDGDDAYSVSRRREAVRQQFSDARIQRVIRRRQQKEARQAAAIAESRRRQQERDEQRRAEWLRQYAPLASQLVTVRRSNQYADLVTPDGEIIAEVRRGCGISVPGAWGYIPVPNGNIAAAIGAAA